MREIFMFRRHAHLSFKVIIFNKDFLIRFNDLEKRGVLIPLSY